MNELENRNREHVQVTLRYLNRGSRSDSNDLENCVLEKKKDLSQIGRKTGQVILATEKIHETRETSSVIPN